MKDKLKTICFVFPYDLNTRFTFIVSLFMIFCLCSFHVITWLLSFYCQDYVFYAHVLSSLIPALNTLHRWSRLWWCMSPQKLFFCYHLPTRGRAGVKLGDAWYVSNVSNFFCSMLVYTPFALCFVTLRGVFYAFFGTNLLTRFLMLHACLYTICFVFCYTSWCLYAFSGTNLLTRCHSASPYFLLFCVSEKLHMKYSQNWTKQKPNLLFLPKLHKDRRWDGGGPGARLTIWWRGPAPGRATTWWGQVAHLLTLPFPL
jgi:hypothetical protein